MKRYSFLLGALLVALLILNTPFAIALRFEFDSEKDIADWELGPQAEAKVKDGLLELTVMGGQNSGIYFGEDNWTDYTMEVHARKKDGTPYFHRVICPTVLAKIDA